MGLGPDHESVVGDILEQYRAGRSRNWYWKQVLAALFTVSLRVIGAHRWHALRAVIVGWGALLAVFAYGDRVAGGMARLLWDWDRHAAWTTGVWGPFHVAATLVSYSGFALSAWVVARLHRQHMLPMLFAYITSMLTVLASFASYLLWLGPVPVAVPHPLFFVISVSLPYHWRSGFVLMPLVMLISGLAAAGSFRETRRTSHGSA
jgi:hypothetical protein